jgi:hypothetical protein
MALLLAALLSLQMGVADGASFGMVEGANTRLEDFRVTVATVACTAKFLKRGKSLEYLLISVRSIARMVATFHSQHPPVRVYVFLDKHHAKHADIKSEFASLHKFSGGKLDIVVKTVIEDVFVDIFGKCSTSKLWMADWLPEEERVIVLDADVVVMEPLSHLWDEFKTHNSTQMVSLAEEGGSWYKDCQTPVLCLNSAKSFPQPSGLNAGVMLADLRKMRLSGFTQELRLAFNTTSFGVKYGIDVAKVPEFKEWKAHRLWVLGDQDVLNFLLFRYPQWGSRLNCRFNLRTDSPRPCPLDAGELS